MEDNKTNNNIITLSVEEYTKIIKENEKFRSDLEHYTKSISTGGGEIVQEHVRPQKRQSKGFFEINE